MTRALPDTWDSERWVIDRLVEAVEAGDGESKQKLAKHLVDGYSEHDWHLRRVTDAGIILPKHKLDIRFADPVDVVAALEEGDTADARLEELCHGATMTEAEAAAWREYVVEQAFDSERVFEHGEGNICVVLEVKHSDGRAAHLALKQWDGQSGSLVAIYTTYDEAMNALRGTGIVSMNDYLAWDEQVKNDSRYR